MDVGHDTSCALATVVDLVNTAPEIAGHEALADLAAVEALVARREISEADSLCDDDLAADAAAAAPGCTAVFAARPTTPRPSGWSTPWSPTRRTTPRLTDHDGWPLHIHYFAPGARLAEHLAADCGMALAFVIAAGERAPAGDSAPRRTAPGCFVDLSRNRSKRYCDSRTCGNRLHVAAYRARQKTG